MHNRVDASKCKSGSEEAKTETDPVIGPPRAVDEGTPNRFIRSLVACREKTYEDKKEAEAISTVGKGGSSFGCGDKAYMCKTPPKVEIRGRCFFPAVFTMAASPTVAIVMSVACHLSGV